MADEGLDKQQPQETDEPRQEKTPKKKTKLMIFIAGGLIVFFASGFFAYTMIRGKEVKSGDTIKEAEKESSETELIALDPFVVNLTEHGRFLKLAIQFEIADKAHQKIVVNKVPQLRDAIIILVSNKSFESISSSEGKFQLKDEILLRANQTIGKDVLKNLYFTEFVTQ